ncbi:BLOC-2 complex member HPS6-like [Conger conger]|uniref:BLOC-2 complex member HPS6-like n=1 Tax=Conger conger TaxID=82655 RepID=UPI002A5AB78D|nr:BLOC-2 complex member HPS6-like [Conger conger]
MKRFVLEQVTDFCDFIRGNDFSDILKENSGFNSYHNGNAKSCFPDIRISPDGHHVHVILRKPKIGLLTFDKYQIPALIQNRKHQDLCLTRTVPILDVVYLAVSSSNSDGGSAVIAVIFQNGKAEFWKYCEVGAGWCLLQSADLCNSPRARVVSVCTSANFIVWCEERPPSESSLATSTTRNTLRYCICKRIYEVEVGAVRLGGVKIALHNNPRYMLTTSGENVYLLPDTKASCLGSISRFFLKWSPQCDTIAVATACTGILPRRTTSTANKESDFKKLISDCVGVLSNINPPDIWASCATECGGLVLLLSSGWTSLLQKDGGLRQVYKLADNCLTSSGGRASQSSMKLYQDILALTVGRSLYLIDTQCGTELEKMALRREGILFLNHDRRHVPHLLSEAGLFLVRHGESEPSSKLPGHLQTLGPDSVLAEAVFEEACHHYQRRSLSSVPLTVEKLKNGGMFQAPISLTSILSDYLKGEGSIDSAQGGASNGAVAHGNLLSSLEPELKRLVALEDVKTSLARASDKDLARHCESLVCEEVSRLLSSEPDRENVLYLNTVFSTFPGESWQALQGVLRLAVNGDGSLSAAACPEVWKAAVAPVQPATARAPRGRAPSNVAVPVFELLCRSFLQFQPTWLPGFLELVQQKQAGASSPSSSSWSYEAKRSSEVAPLYERALSVLPGDGQHQDLEVELLVSSRKPQGVMRALRTLIGRQQWGRATQVAERFSRQSTHLNKEIFSTLLQEVSQHRDLDPYLDLLWALCPEDLTVTGILNIVLKDLPPAPPGGTGPFQAGGSQLTIGLLKPLLSKVLQRETKPSQRYADILQCPSVPFPTPSCQAKTPARVGNGSTGSCKISNQNVTSEARMPTASHHR